VKRPIGGLREKGESKSDYIERRKKKLCEAIEQRATRDRQTQHKVRGLNTGGRRGLKVTLRVAVPNN
jgi:hypothetical protein